MILLRVVFTGELTACRIRMVKRPFTARALTVIPLAKFAFVIITPPLVYQMNHCSVLLLTLTAFALMIIFCYDEMFRNALQVLHCSFSSNVCSCFCWKWIFNVHVMGQINWEEHSSHMAFMYKRRDVWWLVGIMTTNFMLPLNTSSHLQIHWASWEDGMI